MKDIKKIILLEGLPMSGKTTICDNLKRCKNNRLHIVDEIVIISDNNNIQDFFMKNDDLKCNMYGDGIVVIDRGPISTLSYNEAKKKIIGNNEYEKVLNWFEKNYSSFYSNPKVFTYYLVNKKRVREYNDLDIYGSIKNQEILEKITVKNIKHYCLNFKIINYSYEEMENLIDEIIN